MFDHDLKIISGLDELEETRAGILERQAKLLEIDKEISSAISKLKSKNDYSYFSSEITVKGDLEVARKNLDSSLWALVLAESGIYNILSSELSEKLKKKYEYESGSYDERKKDIPEFSANNAREVLGELSNNIANIRRASIVEVFNHLQSSLYRRDKNKRESWEGQAVKGVARTLRFHHFPQMEDGHVYRYSNLNKDAGLFGDLENCFRMIDGKKFLELKDRISTKILNEITSHADKSFPLTFTNEYFKVQVFKKGTVNVRFENEAVLQKFNQLGTNGTKLNA